MSDYLSDAVSDARETVSEFKDTILEQLEENDKASKDLHTDYPGGDRWHHESHIDKYYNLTEAAELIDELSVHEETDSGLWEGCQPKEAIGVCAAFTYGNAVLSEWRDLIDELNGEAMTIIEDFDNRINEADESEDEAGYQDEEYKGPASDDLRDEKKEALEELIDRIAND